MTPLLFTLSFTFGCDQGPRREVPLPVRLETRALHRDTFTLDRGLKPMIATPAAGLTRGPDVVVIVLDTFRADRLAAYGGDPDLAPNLNKFAETATVFTAMRATGSWTLPSHGSLFTGEFPMEHGGHGSPADAATKAYALSTDVPTLAERLTEAGWGTVGIAANRAFLDSIWGLARGFELWMCEGLSAGHELGYAQGDRITGLAQAALTRWNKPEAPAPRPLFLFLNYMDTHTPWVPREGYTAHPERIDAQFLPGARLWPQAKKGRWNRSRIAILSNKRDATKAERETWEEAYNAEVRFVDAQVGALLDSLPSLGVGPEDYVILLSDHGEFLGEHRLLEHSKDLYDEVLRVPLMVRGPGFSPGLNPSPIQTHDVPELILAALGLPPLSDEPPTTDLQVSELYYARHRDLGVPALKERFDRVRRSFVLNDQKLILTEGGPSERYDLRADPQELRPLAEPNPALEDRARAWSEGHVPNQGAAPTLDAAQEERLKALGYMN
ncbi:MAG: sulfatase-like hydrolase/transferase [Deltaproteobacteria bacterium]|nr:sulfatase-like hydrolase/transferase [Deltaproteobacteria bacterium]